MSQYPHQPPSFVPLPVVRTAAGVTFGAIYAAAAAGKLGPVSKLGTRYYVEHDAAVAYLEKARPIDGPAALARLLQPEAASSIR